MASAYALVEGDALQNINNTAEHLLSVLKKQLGELASYDAHAVKLLSDDLDRNRQLYNADGSAKRILWMYGALLGKCIVESRYGGKKVWVDNKVDDYCVQITTAKGEVVMAAPFVRVAKHLQEGAESSIFAYFVAIERVLENGLPLAR